MATKNIPIIGHSTNPDTSGKCFFAPLSTQLSLTNTKDTLVIVMQEPAAGGDIGFEGKFRVPEDYVGTEVLVITYILDGAPGTTEVSFGWQVLAVANDESADQAYGTEIGVAETPGEGDEDLVEETIDISADTYAANDEVFYSFYINDSEADPYLGNVLLTGLYFRYNDA